jgi:hypothetical protein
VCGVSRRVSLAERARIGSHGSLQGLDEHAHNHAPAIAEGVAPSCVAFSK